MTRISSFRLRGSLVATAILILVAFAYSHVTRAEFIWDDLLDFQNAAWLRNGSEWRGFLLRHFNGWTGYFRPLGVAFYTGEVRFFDVKPGPMHIVSLIMHLINTLLVGILAGGLGNLSRLQKMYASLVSMLIYGLHPMLVEPVVWIGCQFDLMAMLFMLLGWVCGINIARPYIRVVSVALCFFLAACSKESAAAFPFIMVVFDWFALDLDRKSNNISRFRMLWRKNRLVYGGVIVSGCVYLALRHWALGTLFPGTGDAWPQWAHLQLVCFLYIRYWGMFLWPTVGMGPVHPIDVAQFMTVSGWYLVCDFLSTMILVVGVMLGLRRKYVGGLILAISGALLPVLHVLALNFSDSLYHERYAMPALAMACVWLPIALKGIPLSVEARKITSLTTSAVLIIWMGLSVLTIRLTVPLWSSQLKLWQWALQEHPDFIYAKDQLISAYVAKRDDDAAWRLIEGLVADNTDCTNCMLNAASLALNEGNSKRAEFFLERIQSAQDLREDRVTYLTYLTLQGELLLMHDEPLKAQRLFQEAISLDNLIPAPQLALSASLAMQGKIMDARKAENSAVSLLAPDDRQRELERFETFLKSLHADRL